MTRELFHIKGHHVDIMVDYKILPMNDVCTSAVSQCVFAFCVRKDTNANFHLFVQMNEFYQ